MAAHFPDINAVTFIQCLQPNLIVYICFYFVYLVLFFYLYKNFNFFLIEMKRFRIGSSPTMTLMPHQAVTDNGWTGGYIISWHMFSLNSDLSYRFILILMYVYCVNVNNNVCLISLSNFRCIYVDFKIIVFKTLQ